MAVDAALYVPFESEVSKKTGLNFYTIAGWVTAEGGPVDNPLNLRPGTDYGSQIAAADAVAANLKGGLYAGVLEAATRKYSSQDAEIAGEANAIAHSPWNNPKQPGSATAAQYDNNIRAGAAKAIFEGLQPDSKVDPGGNIQNVIPNPLGGGILGSAGDALGAIGNAFSWLTNGENVIRILMAVGGGVIVILGLYLALK